MQQRRVRRFLRANDFQGRNFVAAEKMQSCKKRTALRNIPLLQKHFAIASTLFVERSSTKEFYYHPPQIWKRLSALRAPVQFTFFLTIFSPPAPARLFSSIAQPQSKCLLSFNKNELANCILVTRKTVAWNSGFKTEV
jgi:hypothetical protein